MKKQVLSIFAFIIFSAIKVTAQCDFTPRITPHNPVLCPNSKDTLVTTEAYDSYQWYRNNKPIAGETHRYYIAHQQEDAGSLIKVAATKNGCTAFSKKILVDGYVFIPPIIIETGDIGVYDPKLDALVECPGDTLILTLGEPYTQNVQWYKNSKPIVGATNSSYAVTKNGSYNVCGSPEICPDYRACEVIPVNAVYDTLHAVITQSHDTLFASKAKTYQWLYNDQIISGATQNFLVPSRKGSYTVVVSDRYTCTDVSDAYDYAGFNKEDIITVSPNPVHDIVHVQIKSNNASQIVIADLFGNRVMQVPATSSYQTISLTNLHTGNYVIQLLNKQKQVIASAKIFKQ
jgi:hypothetical protein